MAVSMIALSLSAAAFVPSQHVIASRPAVRPQMSFIPPDPDFSQALNSYAGATVIGLFATAALAPFAVGAFEESQAGVLNTIIDDFAAAVTGHKETEEEEICELIDVPASDMHQPVYAASEEEDWWVCSGQELAANCRAVWVDDEYKVACAY